MSGSMIWQNVAVLGYAILLPIAAVLVARVFQSTPPHGSIAHELDAFIEGRPRAAMPDTRRR